MEKIKKLFLLMVILIPAIAFTACGGDDDEPNVPNQTLSVGQSYTIPSDGTWVSDNDLIASIDGKTVKGLRVGEVSIRNGGQSFNVTVNPTITLFKDPCLDFGSSKATVKGFMSGFPSPTEKEESLTYAEVANGTAVGYSYTFKNGKLDMTMVMAHNSIASAERFGEYLAQRYVAVGANDDIIGMVSPDKKVIIAVAVKVYSGNIMYVIVYMPNDDDTKTRSTDISIFEKMINATPGELVKGGMK